MGFPGGAGGKESTCRPGFNPGQEDPPEEEVAPHSSILAWKTQFRGQRSLVGYSACGHEELDTAE